MKSKIIQVTSKYNPTGVVMRDDIVEYVFSDTLMNVDTIPVRMIYRHQNSIVVGRN